MSAPKYDVPYRHISQGREHSMQELGELTHVSLVVKKCSISVIVCRRPHHGFGKLSVDLGWRLSGNIIFVPPGFPVEADNQNHRRQDPNNNPIRSHDIVHQMRSFLYRERIATCHEQESGDEMDVAPDFVHDPRVPITDEDLGELEPSQLCTVRRQGMFSLRDSLVVNAKPLAK